MPALPLPVTTSPPTGPCRAGSLSAVSRPTGLAVLGRPGNSSWFLEKTTGAERKALSLPGRLPPLPRAWGSLPESESAGLRQEALRFLASPRRPPDLAPAPRPTAQILFRRRSRWWREEAQAERGFQGGQAWGFLSPGLGLRPPQ